MRGGRVAEKRWEIHAKDPHYPEQLKEIEDIAPVIYGRGDVDVLTMPCFSIIGARRATPYGLAIAKMAAKVAVECGICVVSGGAMGCDRAAGEGAIEAGGKTIVVCGSGADVVYPKSSGRLMKRAIETGGAVISLEEWGFPPMQHTFLRRNNVIAALSKSLLVTEAGMPSGTFTTANAAVNMGRNVYAAPGSIFSPNSQGANHLIESGALIVVDECSLRMRISMDYGVLSLNSTKRVEDPGPVLRALIANPSRVEELAQHLRMSPLSLLKNLANYEAMGLVKQLYDGRYAPTEAAFLHQDGKGQSA